MTWTSGFTDINLSCSMAAAGAGAAAALTATRAVAASDTSKEQEEGFFLKKRLMTFNYVDCTFGLRRRDQKTHVT